MADPQQPVRGLFIVANTSDGSVREALQIRDVSTSCFPTGAFANPEVIDVLSNGQLRLGRVGLNGTTWEEWAEGIPAVTAGSSGDLFWSLAGYDGTIRRSPWGSPPSIVENGATPSFSMASWSGLLAWVGSSAGATRPAIVVHTGQVGLKIAWRSDVESALRVAFAADRLVWLAASGAHTGEGTYDSASWYSGAINSNGDITNPAKGPQIASRHGLLTLRAFGNTAATIGCDDTAASCSVLMLDVSTNRSWTLRNRPGFGFAAVVGISQSAVLLGEVAVPTPPQDDQGIANLVELQLSALDAWSQ